MESPFFLSLSFDSKCLLYFFSPHLSFSLSSCYATFSCSRYSCKALPHSANNAKEDPAVFGRHPPEPIWLPPDSLCRQAAQHTLQGSGPHGGHAGMSQGGDAPSWDKTGTLDELVCILPAKGSWVVMIKANFYFSLIQMKSRHPLSFLLFVLSWSLLPAVWSYCILFILISEQCSSAAFGGTGQNPGIPPVEWPGSEVTLVLKN